MRSFSNSAVTRPTEVLFLAASKCRRRVTLCALFLVLFTGVISNAMAQSIYEAENATMVGPSASTVYPGYSGTGYADYNNNSADYVEFSLNASTAGTYPLAFRYANGGTTGSRPLELKVNGAVINSALAFPVTSGWSTWAFTATNSVPFNAGSNTVRITATGTSGANVDYLLVTVNGTTNIIAGTNTISSFVSAPLRRPISANQPLWIFHIDTWNYADPQKIIDLIPPDIRPYVVMNISLSINHATNKWLQVEYAYETAKSWIRTCAENRMWATIQPASGGFTQFPDSDLAMFEEFFRNYPNFIGFNYAEQFWGFDDPWGNSVSWTQRVAHWVDLMKLNQKYGGYLIASWCGGYYGANINPIAMMKRNPAFAAICSQSPQNFILEEKFTSNYGFYDIESTCLGTWLSGYSGNYGIRYDNSGWVGYTTNDAFHVAAASAPLIEHAMLTGQTVMDGPELIWDQAVQGLSNGTTTDGYSTRRWQLFTQLQNVSLDIYRKILDGTIRIPTRNEVIDRSKAVIVSDSTTGTDQNKYSAPQSLYSGLYLMSGDGTNVPDGTYLNQHDYFKKSGRYPAVPVVYRLGDTNAHTFSLIVSNSLYPTRWPTDAAKTNELNTYFPAQYTGSIYAGRQENAWAIYNPFKSGQTATGSIPFQYNTCDHVDLSLSQYTAGVMKEYSNSVSFYLNNFDGTAASARTDLITIYGSSAEPTYSWADRASHSASTVTKSWSGGVWTLTITHNGPLDITVNCAGTATGRLTSYTSASITIPDKPMVYTGVHQYEAENFDTRNILGDVTQGVNSGVSNYTAQGYLKFGTSSTASIRDVVTVLKNGIYRLNTKYSVAGSDISTIDLYVNGNKMTTPVFTQTASLSDWAVNQQSIGLKAGTNTLEFRAKATGASPIYFDNIVIVPQSYGDGVVIQENSKGFVSVDGTIDNSGTGYTGTGFANTSDTNGAGINWSVVFDSSVTKGFTFRYASTNDGTADLFINGTNVAANIQFPSTGSNSSWDFVTVYASTPAGLSDVRLQASSALGLPNVDSLEVIGGNVPNTAPTLTAIANQALGVGTTLLVANMATDPDLPAQTLTFSLLTAPINAVINNTSGVITWRPDVTQANTTNTFTVVVTDNGTPNLSATQNFTAVVGPLAQPNLSTATLNGGQFVFQVTGDTGPDYLLQTSTNLVNWDPLFTNYSPAMPFSWTNNTPDAPMNFYRVLTGPPF